MKALELRGLAGVLRTGWFVAPLLSLLLFSCAAWGLTPHLIHTHTQVTSNLTVSLSPVRQWRSRRG